MTWIEITFWVLLVAVFIGGIIIDVDFNEIGACFLLPILYVVFLGFFPCAITSINTKTTFVREEPIKIINNTMIGNDKLLVVTDKGETFTFTSYADITNINSGKGLVRRFYEKNVYYGPDSDWSDIEIKK